jgi:ubiquinone/menaquinone biosynthesis C-methylase UbiE
MMSTIAEATRVGWQEDFWRCVNCGDSARASATGEMLACDACGRTYPITDDLLIVHDQISANNEVARGFYDGPLWPKFRFWEWFTWFCNGGERKARDKVLRHLPKREGLKLLDVAVGDGVYLPWLPESWKVVGVDVSRVQLSECKKRAQGRDVRLVLGEAEDLPVSDGAFDAALSIGGFNYFNDPERALREMARAVKPGGVIVVSDEVPNLTDRMFFRKIGLPAIDRWIIARGMHLGEPFTDMVERYRELDVQEIGRRVLADFESELIWREVGYVMVGRAPY